MRNDPEVQQAAAQWQLGLPRSPVAGRSGELLGRGTGSSLEFQEHREYMPGDDIRHLDWAAWGRSDALMVRLFREEISPRIEILLDVSRSMETGPGSKAATGRRLAALLAVLSAKSGGQPAITLLGDEQPPRVLNMESLESLATLESTASSTMVELLAEHRVPLRPQAVRIVISDFLFPHDPGILVRQLANQASALWLVQLLTSWEADPRPSGGRRLVDVETAGEIDLRINRTTIDQYLERLHRLQEELDRNCRRVHAAFIRGVADQGLAGLCRTELNAAGLIRPA